MFFQLKTRLKLNELIMEKKRLQVLLFDRKNEGPQKKE
jgi:hypothetical protein